MNFFLYVINVLSMSIFTKKISKWIVNLSKKIFFLLFIKLPNLVSQAVFDALFHVSYRNRLGRVDQC